MFVSTLPFPSEMPDPAPAPLRAVPTMRTVYAFIRSAASTIESVGTGAAVGGIRVAVAAGAVVGVMVAVGVDVD